MRNKKWAKAEVMRSDKRPIAMGNGSTSVVGVVGGGSEMLPVVPPVRRLGAAKTPVAL